MYCRVLLLGRLGAAPELNYTQTGFPVGKMRVATSERRKNQNGEYEEKTEWHNVKVFSKQAENCVNYLKKGSLVFIEGKIHNDMWEKDGQKHYRTEIIASKVQFLDKSEKKNGNGGFAEPQGVNDADVYYGSESLTDIGGDNGMDKVPF